MTQVATRGAMREQPLARTLARGPVGDAGHRARLLVCRGRLFYSSSRVLRLCDRDVGQRFDAHGAAIDVLHLPIEDHDPRRPLLEPAPVSRSRSFTTSMPDNRSRMFVMRLMSAFPSFFWSLKPSSRSVSSSGETPAR